MYCKCYKLSVLTAVDGNSTFRNFTLKVARRNEVNCNRQFSMVIIILFFLRQSRSVRGSWGSPDPLRFLDSEACFTCISGKVTDVVDTYNNWILPHSKSM